MIVIVCGGDKPSPFDIDLTEVKGQLEALVESLQVTMGKKIKRKSAPNLLKRVRVKKIDVNTNETIAVYDSVSLAAEKNGIGQSNISDVCRGARKTTGGFKWEYAD